MAKSYSHYFYINTLRTDEFLYYLLLSLNSSRKQISLGMSYLATPLRIREKFYKVYCLIDR